MSTIHLDDSFFRQNLKFMYNIGCADMAELVDAPDLGSGEIIL